MQELIGYELRMANFYFRRDRDMHIENLGEEEVPALCEEDDLETVKEKSAALQRLSVRKNVRATDPESQRVIPSLSCS